MIGIFKNVKGQIMVGPRDSLMLSEVSKLSV